MGALLDILGSVFTGTLVLITIITSILNFQELHYNIRTMITLADIGEQVMENFDKYYLANIEEVDRIYGSKMIAKGKLDLAVVDSMIIEVGKTKDGLGYPLTINVVNMATKNSTLSFGPFTVADTTVFTFYDLNMNEITSNDSLANIRNIRVNLTFIEKGWERVEGEKKYITHPVMFWKCFKTIYVNSLSK